MNPSSALPSVGMGSRQGHRSRGGAGKRGRPPPWDMAQWRDLLQPQSLDQLLRDENLSGFLSNCFLQPGQQK